MTNPERAEAAMRAWWIMVGLIVVLSVFSSIFPYKGFDVGSWMYFLALAGRFILALAFSAYLSVFLVHSVIWVYGKIRGRGMSDNTIQCDQAEKVPSEG